MKKRLKIINIIIVLLILFVPLLVLAEPTEGTNENLETAQKGDLRCPEGSTNCQAIENGVQITERKETNSSYVQITKTVTKTESLGKYQIQFSIQGNGVIPQRIPEEAYVTLVLDASTTIGNTRWKNQLVPAAKSFAEYLIPDSNNGNSNYHLSLVKFNDTIYVPREFSERNFNDLGFGSVASGSNLYSALYQTVKRFKNYYEEDAKKYVVIFADGRYVNWEGIERYLAELRSNNVEILIIGFGDASKPQYEQRLTNWADTYYKAYGENPNYTEVFNKVALDISESVGTTVGKYAVLTDYMGSAFSASQTTKVYKLAQITQQPQNLEPAFYIDIDKFSPTNWYETNNHFELTYMTNEGEQKIYSDQNPEAYWVQEIDAIEGCSGAPTMDSTRDQNSVITDYYEKYCDEGYTDENGIYQQGFKAEISVNNIPIPVDATVGSVKLFDIEQGIGFPTDIKMTTNVKCHFEFNVSKFTEEYNKAKTEKEEAEKNIANYERQISSLSSQISSLSSQLAGMLPYDIIPGYTICDPITDSGVDTDDGNLGGETGGSDNIDSGGDVTDSEAGTDGSMDTETGVGNGSNCITVPDTQVRNETYFQLQSQISSLEISLKNYNNLLKYERDTRLKAAENELKRLDKVKSDLKNVLGQISIEGDIADYADRFTEQSADLYINYVGSVQDESLEFVNNDATVKNDYDCEEPVYATVIDERLLVKHTCKANFEKEMMIPQTCLDMKTADKEQCISDNSQLNGGNKFYTDLEADKGEVRVNISNAGFSEKFNINLQGCYFEKSPVDVIFRQIDLEDPFLKTYDPARGVGRNFSNSTFNFINIIKSNVWSGESLYDFKMSKVNVRNIKNDTREEGSDSYLGRNCYFATLGNEDKYMCEFVKSDDGQFFQK